MSISINAFTIAKRRNSTLIPGGGTTFLAALKEDTSVVNPTFTLHESQFPYTELQATIDGVTRYYFVDDVISVAQNLYEVRCTCDVLASWKSYITSTPCYILYATSGYSSALVDQRIPVNYTASTARNQFSVFDGIYNAAGTYILSCVGEGSTGVNNYALNPGEFMRLMARIAEYQDIYNVNWPAPQTGSVEEVLEWVGDLFKTFFEASITTMKQITSFGNALQAIRACTWIPFRPETSGGGEIVLGGYHTGMSGSTVNAYAQTDMVNTTVPWIYGDWRDSSRHTDVFIYLPWVGVASLPTSQIQGETTLGVSCSLSPLTGDISYIVVVGDKLVGAFGASIGCSVPIGVSNVNPLQSFNSIASGAAAMITNPIGGASSIVAGASAAITPVSSFIGGCGNSSAGGQNQRGYVFCVGHGTPEAPDASAAVRGRPAFHSGTPSTGYCQTQGFQVIAPCSGGEKDMINSMMDGGVYIE